MRRGQAAIEWLLSYGYAILGLLAVLGVLAYLYGGHTYFLPPICDVDVPFACVEHRVGSEGEVTLAILNTGEPISEITTTLFCNRDLGQQESYTSQELIDRQERINRTYLLFSCPIHGSLFSGDIEIDYRLSGQNVHHLAKGRVRGPPEG